ncbi:MAG TPA: prepilin-type N-terminal cleavage/methylation domain-containing protein [Patescibacteria group bacterium]|nr:prepilin-type N-terminal cleavage/methylation domain-containing protein [Patescibacteria group bacterium]
MRISLGFTLIELLVVIVLIGLLVTGSIAGYTKFNQRQVLLTSGKEFITILRTAQARAHSGVKPPSNCTTLLGYSVRASRNSSSYTMAAQCSNTSITANSYKLAAGVIFDTPVDITFDGLSGGVSGTIGDLSLSYSDKTYLLTINEVGSITEGGIQ